MVEGVHVDVMATDHHPVAICSEGIELGSGAVGARARAHLGSAWMLWGWGYRVVKGGGLGS